MQITKPGKLYMKFVDENGETEEQEVFEFKMMEWLCLCTMLMIY